MLCSADIGLAWYADRDDPTNYYIGSASGKLFHYLKHGLPVVTNRFPGLPEIVEAHDAGICLEHEAGIGDGLVKIEQEYNHYSRNARACFVNYEFSSRFSKVLDFIQAKLSQYT
jgi:glycosyltransferase involved in cell wall biosynthesis